MNWLKQNWIKITPPAGLTLLVFIIYSTGFVIWNKYLSVFGFFEYNFIQLRYFSAGFIFWVVFVIFAEIIYSIFYFAKIKILNNKFFLPTIIIGLLLIY